MKEEVLEFIKRRFKNDCNWLDGNCYYFSLILKDRFPMGDIYYDIIWGHFCLKINEDFFDFNGIYTPTKVIKWENFDEYDSLLKQLIIRDCIK